MLQTTTNAAVVHNVQIKIRPAVPVKFIKLHLPSPGREQQHNLSGRGAVKMLELIFVSAHVLLSLSNLTFSFSNLSVEN